MAEEQINTKSAKFVTSATEQYFENEVSKCVIVRNNVCKTEESDDFISVPMCLVLLETVKSKIRFVMSEITTAMMKNQSDKYDALYMELQTHTKGFIPENNDYPKEYENITNPEIHKLISNGFNPKEITKYIITAGCTVIEQYLADEINKCLLVKKTESSNSENEFIPVSKLEGLLDIWMTKFSSEVLEMVADIMSKQEDRYNSLLTIKEDRLILIKQYNNVKNEAKITQNYDLLTKIDDVRIPKTILNNMHRLYNNDDKDFEEMKANYEKKTPSIICRIASRNKKLEIISTRKQLKGKREPLQRDAP